MVKKLCSSVPVYLVLGSVVLIMLGLFESKCLSWAIAQITLLPMIGIVIFFRAVPYLIEQGYGLILLCVCLLNFLPAFFLRWKLPEQSKYLATNWLVICFLMGLAYYDVYWYYPLFLGTLPALAGVVIGAIVKDWKWRDCV